MAEKKKRNSRVTRRRVKNITVISINIVLSDKNSRCDSDRNKSLRVEINVHIDEEISSNYFLTDRSTRVRKLHVSESFMRHRRNISNDVNDRDNDCIYIYTYRYFVPAASVVESATRGNFRSVARATNYCWHRADYSSRYCYILNKSLVIEPPLREHRTRCPVKASLYMLYFR